MIAQVKRILEAVVSANKGTNINLCWKRPVKCKKNSPKIEKEVCSSGRLGVKYDNIGAVQAKRASGELPAQNAGLPDWQEWQMYPYLLAHKTSGQVYLRMTPSTLKHAKTTVTWYCNGVECDYDVIKHFLYASEKIVPNKPRPDVFMVKIENMVSVDKAE